MQIEQLSWTAAKGWRTAADALNGTADLVLVFGGSAALDDARFDELSARFAGACLIGCTSAGERFFAPGERRLRPVRPRPPHDRALARADVG